MQTYIAILRGINVSGHNMIKMDALRKTFEDLNFKNVRTYIQSGNVIFECPKTEGHLLENKIAKKIREDYSAEVPVIVMDRAEIEKVYKNNPFVNKYKRDINFLHVTFLARNPEKSDVDRITGDFGLDEFVILDTSIYLFCPNGYGRTKLNNNYFENKLKVTATTRNWKTIAELVKISKAFK